MEAAGQDVKEVTVRIGGEVYLSGLFRPVSDLHDPMRRGSPQAPECEVWTVDTTESGAFPFLYAGNHRDLMFGRRAWRLQNRIAFRWATGVALLYAACMLVALYYA
jgi:hypothetical protein